MYTSIIPQAHDEKNNHVMQAPILHHCKKPNAIFLGHSAFSAGCFIGDLTWPV